MKFVLFVFLSLWGGSLLAAIASESEIYSWIDKNGTVHYSDKPNSASAKLIDIKKTNATQEIESQVQFPTNVARNNTNGSNSVEQDDGVSDVDPACIALEKQIARAKKDLKNDDPYRAEFAENYLASAKKIYKDTGCK